MKQTTKERKKKWKRPSAVSNQESSFVSSEVKKICVITIYQVRFHHLRFLTMGILLLQMIY